MEVRNYLVSWVITYLYRGYNPVTKYNGHPSILSERKGIVQVTHTCLYKFLNDPIEWALMSYFLVAGIIEFPFTGKQ